MKKDVLAKFPKMYQELEKKGVKLQMYWTLGHYNFVTIMEAPSEMEAMKLLVPFVDVGDVEVLTAIPREEALKIL
jgi:uncharacterized protein with GYD domain